MSEKLASFEFATLTEFKDGVSLVDPRATQQELSWAISSRLSQTRSLMLSISGDDDLDDTHKECINELLLDRLEEVITLFGVLTERTG